MKKTLSLFLLLALMLPILCMAEESVTEPFSWRGYSLSPTLFTADEDIVRNYNGPTGGIMVMVQLAPQEGKIALTDIKEHGEDFALITSDGKNFPCYAWSANDFKEEKAPNSIFPEIADEQDDFGLTFFLKGKDEKSMDGACLSVKDGNQTLSVSLDPVSRHLPDDSAE